MSHYGVSMNRTSVFVSYSHADSELVTPVVSLLRANDCFVFLDVDRIKPGKKWRLELESALKNAKLVVVFWCLHASESAEVTQEWSAAIDNGADVLPLLLDDTSLPDGLAEYQWIDFRGTVGAAHFLLGEGLGDAPFGPTGAPENAPPSAPPRRWIFGAGFVGVAAIFAAVIYVLTSSPDSPNDLLFSPPMFLLLIVISSFAIVGYVRNTRVRSSSSESERPQNRGHFIEGIRQSMAHQIEAELARRAGASRSA